MKFSDLPLVGRLSEVGPDTPVYDGLLLLGPIVIAVVAFGGRNLATVGVAGAYLVAFVSYVLYEAIQGGTVD